MTAPDRKATAAHAPTGALHMKGGNCLDASGEPFFGTAENWAEVCRRWNAHAALVEALRQAIEAMQDADDYFAGNGDAAKATDLILLAMDQARAALALAEEDSK